MNCYTLRRFLEWQGWALAPHGEYLLEGRHEVTGASAFLFPRLDDIEDSKLRLEQCKRTLQAVHDLPDDGDVNERALKDF